MRAVRLSSSLWDLVGMWTAVLFVGLLGTRMVFGDPYTLAGAAGQLLSLSVLSGLTVGLLARYVRAPWPRWLYPVAIFGVALALAFATQGLSNPSDGSDPAPPGAASARGAVPSQRHL